MAPGISKVKQLSTGSAGRVKKQLNDLYLFISYKLHRELATFGVISVNPDLAKTANILLIPTNPQADTVKEWEASVTLDLAPRSDGNSYPTLSGEQVLLVTESPVGVDNDMIVHIGAKRAADKATATVTVTATGGAVGDTVSIAVGAVNTGAITGATVAALTGNLVTALNGLAGVTATAAAGAITITGPAAAAVVVTLGGTALANPLATALSAKFSLYSFHVKAATGLDQALAFVDDKGLPVQDIVDLDWVSLNAGVVGAEAAANAPSLALYTATGMTAPAAGSACVVGANKGQALKLMVVPSAKTDWLYHAFVRQINPAIPKDYKEVADHFDGAAATIRATIIPTLTIQKVFESVPGSFRNMRGRTCTLKTETRELNRFDSSETHFFLGVVGTPSIQFQMDNESISQLEAIMYRWIVLS